MNNKTGFNRLGRNASHRRALLKNLATSLIKHGQIETTQAKAKELRSVVEKLVTRARVDSVHNRRVVAKFITDKEVAKKLFTEVAVQYVGRPGGYTRIVKTGQRRGDASPMAIIAFVEPNSSAPAKKEATVS
ncbi:50S ribosomal protein L17 [Entomospira culicis]|uniref:Large ribosomal subunit protein bL17 n=1 Tax=Entomospira culicis TaxID=2719989 RepID=A0A968KW65_9SPIO|nr:50S ribosomal protein L17 [Entomospira culicis]NIZ19694.1 50S ribosomal protein L17 [Entomospira culicis]NIZ69908.1 50S ribosomal protein L17 [Entomospira culicis]WDI37013.1 50S ribosomal protein L17 [Entomospira culicis]WDI38642.1 50S ribosomal protein L17 [Entomospira culicis]